VHNSYIVAIHAIQTVKFNEMKVQNETIPIGTTYKQEVLKKLKGRASGG
jgi:hypothetical protein